MLKSDERKLEAFHMSCQRHILRIRWFHHVTNAEVTSQTEQEDLTSHIPIDGVRRYLDTSVNYLRRRQVGWLCDWQSTRELEAVPTTTHIGSNDQDNRDTPGSDKWRPTPVSPLMMHGTLPSIAAVGGRNDPSWSSETDDDGDERLINMSGHITVAVKTYYYTYPQFKPLETLLPKT